MENTDLKERELGKITNTMLGKEDHGIFTFVLYFDFGDSGQGFGTYRLDKYNKKKEEAEGSAFGLEAIMRVLEAVGVDTWEELPGNEMWVIRDESKMIRAIEAPKYRKSAGRRFDIRELAEKYKNEVC